MIHAVSVADPGEVVIPILVVIGCAVASFLAAGIVSVIARRLARRYAIATELTSRSRRPLRATFLLISIWIAIAISTDPARWTRAVGHGLFVSLIATVTWLIATLAFVVEDAMLHRFRVDVPDNRQARRIRTQIAVVRRVTVVLLVVCASAAILLTFPEARGVGASLFASAGLLSIVAGLAAQSSLANFFAGTQLVFTDAIRVDDVVVVAGEWGRIEEITLTYVVVHVWDDRRLILPSTYFTTTPFENWTRRAADLIGAVELDVDWEVPVEEVRAELTRLLMSTPLWDKRVGVLQVTDAVHGFVRLRALASALDAPTLFDLRCFVREGLIAWLHEYAPQALPRTRTASLVRFEADEGVATMPSPEPASRPARPMPAPIPPTAPEPRPTGHRGPPAGAATGGPPLPPGVVRRRSARVATRAGAEVPPGPRPDDTQRIDVSSDSSMFTGSIEAIERAQAFAGPGEDVIAEREAHAAGQADRAARTGEQPVLGPERPAVVPPPDERRLVTGDSPDDAGGDAGHGGDGGHGGHGGGGGGGSGGSQQA